MASNEAAAAKGTIMILSFTSIATVECKALLNIAGRPVVAKVRGNTKDDALDALRFELQSLLRSDDVSCPGTVKSAEVPR